MAGITRDPSKNAVWFGKVLKVIGIREYTVDYFAILARKLLEKLVVSTDTLHNTTATLSAFGYRETLAVFLWACEK